MKEDLIVINKNKFLNHETVTLPASKSISNRVLIVDALCDNGGEIHNLSEARDTITMQRLLRSDDDILDVIDAGTTMRFLTAYLATTGQKKVLTGTPRMCQRPIKILVDALRYIGADIEYLQQDGFPPLSLKGFPGQKQNALSIRGDVSSQYISALLMIAPSLPQGLTLTLLGKVGSRPYIQMTLMIMESYGVKAAWKDDKIHVEPQSYRATTFAVEPDWSGASYWYSFLALSGSDQLKVRNLRDQSLQGDRAIADMMSKLGVKTSFDEFGATLQKTTHDENIHIDFSDCPDLAQTVAVYCAAKGIYCTMTGLESLKIKETDRVQALQNELAKIGATLKENDQQWKVIPSRQLPAAIRVDTYDDHRMAMAFAPLSTLMDVTIEAPHVVNKSFPGFWNEMKKLGFKIEAR
ncbi:MAG: 3-phosphoshikimate 1-carboxyvinyltransferase [Fulvivirga sp.]|nr:3-phosphoshikimate 1-carboxyvinyltransferase [Fulvivirga sp.]